MRSDERETFTGWACVDCLMILANGEDNPEWSEEETAAHHAAMDKQIGDCEITLGLWPHEDDCPNVDHETGEWLGTTDCYCETQEFSWRSCSVCGSHLGGSRHAVTFWPVSAVAS